MYLKELELKGFKSFPEKTDIIFKNGITAIVGPNGSGKSNISDAVRWVLGEQSIKSLRGDKLEDVIFAGSDKKKPMNYCEVSLTIDNSDGEIEIDFTELTIKRRAYRNGESQFFLNGKPCRLKDIKELFLDTGIGKDSYSIIEQGKVDEILSNNPLVRRKVFDEACGIAKYRYKKQEAERNLKNTSENLERINDIYIEIEKQINPLKNQKEKAEKFLEISGRLKELEVNSFLREINKIDKESKEVKISLEESEKKINDGEEKNKSLEKEYEDFKLESEVLDEEIEKENEYISSLKEVISQKESEINLITEKSNNKKKDIDRKNEEISKLSTLSEKNDEDKKENLQKIELLNIKREELENKLEKKGSKNSDKKEHIDSLEKKIDELKDNMINLLNEKQSITNNVSSLEANRDNMNQRWQTIDESTDENEKNIKNTSKNIEKEKEELEAINLKFEDVDKNIAENIEKIETTSKKISELEKNITDNKYELNEFKSKKKIYVEMENQYDGFNRGVKEVLKNKNLKGIDGAVAQVISVSEKYEKAIEASLAAAMQNIITEDEESAKKAIEFLKKTEGGRVTFLPLNVVTPNLIDLKDVKSKIEPIGIASDLLEFGDKYRNVVESLLGKTVVIEDIDQAIQFARDTKYKIKIATLDGEILKPGGSITGGSIKNSANLLSRKRIISEYTEKIESISELIEKEEIEFKNLKEEKKALYSEKDKLVADKNSVEKNILLKKAEIKKLEEKIGEYRTNIEKLEREKESISSNMEYTISKLNSANEKIEEIDKKSEKSREEVENLNKELEENRILYDKDRKEFEELNIELVNLNNELKSLDSNTSRISMENENTVIKIEGMKKEIEVDLKDVEEFGEKIKAEELEKANIQKEQIEANRILENKRLKRTELKNTLDEKSKELKRNEREISEFKEELYKVNSKLERFKSNRENYLNKMFEQYDMTFMQASELRNDELQITKKEIETLKREKRAIGSVNLNSIEEYKETKERYDLYSSQKADLEESISGITKLIKELEHNMKIEFVEKFEEISKNFKEVYTKLFGGGTGELTIADKENILESDIIITAQPPGKKMKNINLLSGGEKALTAICILFAIIISRPTPFCILDEIEAPLDDINVYRFGEFLKELSEETQFIAVTHRRGTMEAAEYIYGVTMQERAISKIISLKLQEAEKFAGLI